MTVESVYKQRDNTNIVNFTDGDGVVLDFSAATRMVLKFEGTVVEVDTDIDPTFIDFSAGGGDITFKLNDVVIDAGEYSSSLIVYDPAHSDGQIIVHASENELFFCFIDPI